MVRGFEETQESPSAQYIYMSSRRDLPHDTCHLATWSCQSGWASRKRSAICKLLHLTQCRKPLV